jgi:hypothetical protein
MEPSGPAKKWEKGGSILKISISPTIEARAFQNGEMAFIGLKHILKA